MIPHQRSHAVAALHSQPLQRRRKLPRAFVHLPVTRSRDTAIRPAGNNLDLREKSSGALQDSRKRQREIHHRAGSRHPFSPLASGRILSLFAARAIPERPAAPPVPPAFLVAKDDDFREYLRDH